MSDWIVGNIIEVPLTIQTTASATLVDPATLDATVTAPDGTSATYSYPDAAHLTRQSIGEYTLSWTADQDGRWYWNIVTTGTGAGVGDGYVDVRALYSQPDARLTSVEAVREFLQKPDSDTAQDNVIEELIGRASAAIERFCQRKFTASGVATRSFLTRNGYLSFAPYELQAATEVIVDSNTLTAGSDGYQLRPVPAHDGVYRYALLPGYLTGEYEASVTGTWGWPQIPADVEHWCIVTVGIWLRRDVSAFSASLRLEEDRMERPDALPSAARLGLRHYRRPWVP